ncbi:MAG: amidohydrolase family protein [Clostridiales bacterium]|nr:amidohydrolase family protein [Clostridiales bacterium]
MKKICIHNGMIIDGNGEILLDSAIIIEDGKIKIIDHQDVCNHYFDRMINAKGLTILPGFINAHAHTGFKYVNNVHCKGFQEEYLLACINEGITTIRDEGMFTGDTLEDVVIAKRLIERNNNYPRIVTTGKFFTAPKGYGGQAPIEVETIDEVDAKIEELLSLGIDMVKTVLEDGLDPSTHGLPKLSDDLLKVICNKAHEKGVKVSAHVTQSHNLKRLVDAGIDDAAHMVYDDLSDELINEMVHKNIFVIPTLTVSKMISDKYGAPVFESTKKNVMRFVDAGGNIALGDDFIEEESPWYRLGMPKLELQLLKEAGLTNMQIIIAATRNGAIVCGLDKEIGTIESGKRADLLLIEGNPLENIEYIYNVRMVIKDGCIIVEVIK